MSKFQVGQWWRTRSGSLIQITWIGSPEFSHFPVVCNDDRTRTVEGHFYGDGDVSQYDLVERVTEPSIEERAAVATLERLGYTYEGGELWKPPLGKREPRPFDLEAAKRGEPIVTRDGRKAVFVAHLPEAREGHQVVVYLGDIRRCLEYFESGAYAYDGESDEDLFMAP